MEPVAVWYLLVLLIWTFLEAMFGMTASSTEQTALRAVRACSQDFTQAKSLARLQTCPWVSLRTLGAALGKKIQKTPANFPLFVPEF